MEDQQSTELAMPEELLNPISGELVLTSDIDRVAVTLDQLKQHRQRVNEAIAEFTFPLLLASRQQGTKTLRAGGLTFAISSGFDLTWDTEVLLELLDAGLPQERYDELVTQTVEFKVNGSVARALSGSNPAYAEIIERARIRNPKTQSATVKA